MKCVVPGGNVKILAKAIHTLAKIGDEVYVNPQKESVSFRTVNMAKSAYSDFMFHKNFFSYYTLGDLSEGEAQKCKISMRSAMTVFKSAHTIDKQVETCHIHLEIDACNLVFIFKYKNGIKKSHLTPILDTENLQVSYTKDGMVNELASRARTLMDALQNFAQTLIEITLEITPHKLLFRNYVDEASVMVNTTRTQLALGSGEFDRYTIGNETSVTFCLKELRALLGFSENVGVPITASFGTSGRPILFILKSQAFEANMLMSTLSPEGDNQSDSSVVSRKIQSARRKNASSKSISRNNKSSTRSKKPVNHQIDDMFKNKSLEKKNQLNQTCNQNGNVSVGVISAKANNSINDIRENNLHTEEQSRHSVAFNPISTSSTTNRKISEGDRKLVNSVFSSITKRKSTNDGENCKKKEDPIDCIDLEEDVPRSPSPRRVSKKARVVFQKCFENTFDPRMLPGHDTILVEDSDENNSD